PTSSTDYYTLSLHDALPILLGAMLCSNNIVRYHRRRSKGFAGTQLEFPSFEVRGLVLYRPAAKHCSNNILQREHRSSKGFAGTQDRKSTRLNSSHVSISYAV